MLGTEPQLKRNFARLKRFQPHARIDILLENRVGILGGDLLDFHSARRRSHEYRLAFGAVDENSQIQLFFNRKCFFNQQTPHDAALGTCLMSNELHAQNFARQFPSLVHRLGNLYAASLAPPTSMDLRFDYDSVRASIEQLFGSRLGFFPGSGHRAARNRHTIFLKNSFCLVLMDFHKWSLPAE